MARTHSIGLMLLAAWLAAPAVAAEGIAWRHDVEAAKHEAAGSGRLVLLHFSGTFCPPCRAMEQTVFNRADVAQAVEQNYVPVAVDVEKNPALKQQFDVRPIPADVIVTPEGQVINKSVGYKSAPDYVAALSHYARLARRTAGDRQAEVQAPPMPDGLGQPQANSGATRNPFATDPTGSPDGSFGNASGGNLQPRWQPQPSPLAPRVGQQYLTEQMLQPPPAPDAGNRGAAGGGSSLLGPPANGNGGSTPPPWRQQDLAGPAGSGVPGAGPGAAPRGASANPPNAPPWATPPSAGTAPSAPGAPPPGAAPFGPSPGTPRATPSPGAPPAQPQAPGFGGHCPVTMYHEGRWAAGDRRWGVIHEGRLYLFASEQAKEAFWRDPNRYAPVFGGDDVVLFVESGQRVPGQVRIGAMQGEKDPRIYLFANELSYRKFDANTAFYIERLRQMTSGAGNR